MHTKIHTSKRFEKLVKKLIKIDTNIESGILGKWNATIFYVNRKKCLLLSNARTQYNIILADFKTSDLNNIEESFKNAFYTQLNYDEIKIDFDDLCSIIGGIFFYATDNDRKTNGFLNHRIQDLECWKLEYGSIENMPINELTKRLNTSPIHIGVSHKISDYTNAIDEMKKLLDKKLTFYNAK